MDGITIGDNTFYLSGIIMLFLIFFAPPILWTIVFKKCFKLNIISSIVIALVISVGVFSINESLVRVEKFLYIRGIICLIHLGLPILLLMIPRKIA